MNRQEFRFFDRLRVRWAEIDAQKIVFNGHYLMYFDTAMTAYWRALALPYAETMRCARIGTSSMLFAGGVFRQDELLVGGEIVYVFADPHSQTSKPVPEALRKVLLGFEAGEAVLDVRTGGWSELGQPARALREEVFVLEQKIPAALEWDAADGDAIHAVAFNRFGMPLATGRLVLQQGAPARIGRMATSRLVRNSGVGRQVLDALIAAARSSGARELMLHAQTSAQNFYLRAGFLPHGEVFEEAGIAHIEMRRTL
jgi:predicted GNAT family N-acyltransferase/acyl-CoA thioesterase FadM